MKKTRIVKVVMVGSGGSGKTTLMNTLQTSRFDFSTKITIGVDFHFITVPLRSDLTLMIFDLGGVNRFRDLYDVYSLGYQAGIILYDLLRWETFHEIPKWINFFQEIDPTKPLIIVGNKNDALSHEELSNFRKGISEMIQKAGNPPQVERHFFVSAKSLSGMSAFFSYLVHLLI